MDAYGLAHSILHTRLGYFLNECLNFGESLMNPWPVSRSLQLLALLLGLSRKWNRRFGLATTEYHSSSRDLY